MFESILPEWMSMTEWLEPKLVLLIGLVATILWLSNLGSSKRARQERNRADRTAAIIKNTRQ